MVNISMRLVGILGMIRLKDLSPQLTRPRTIHGCNKDERQAMRLFVVFAARVQAVAAG